MAAQVTAAGARGQWGRWPTCWPHLSWFRRFPPVTGMSGSRLHESHRPRRIIVQPAQLSLLPDQVPAPPPDLLAQLPGPQVTAVIMLLAALIARAGGLQVTGDEW